MIEAYSLGASAVHTFVMIGGIDSQTKAFTLYRGVDMLPSATSAGAPMADATAKKAPRPWQDMRGFLLALCAVPLAHLGCELPDIRQLFVRKIAHSPVLHAEKTFYSNENRSGQGCASRGRGAGVPGLRPPVRVIEGQRLSCAPLQGADRTERDTVPDDLRGARAAIGVAL